MQQIERSTVITYRWWTEGKNEIKPEHIPELEAQADARVAAMMAEGYTSGSLNASIRITDADPEAGTEYVGWWEVSKLAEVGRPGAEGAKTEIIEVKFTRQSGNDWIVRLSDRDGWWMLPIHSVSADTNMRNIRQFKGDPAAFEAVSPSAIMGLAMCRYPVQAAYYETAKSQINLLNHDGRP